MKGIFLMMGVLMVTSQAQAGLLNRQSEGKLIQELSKTPNHGNQCADFAGRWIGECAATGQPVENATVLITQQGCDSVVVDGQFAAIGGTVSESHSIPQPEGDVHSTTTSNLSWNENKTAIAIFTETYLYKTGIGLVYADRLQGYLALSEGRLVSYSKGQYGEATCTFSLARK
jgi:hypothetical protein